MAWNCSTQCASNYYRETYNGGYTIPAKTLCTQVTDTTNSTDTNIRYWTWNCTGNSNYCDTNLNFTWWDGNLDQEVITASELNDLRYRINLRIDQIQSRYGTTNYVNRETSAIGTSTIITNEFYNNLDLMVGSMPQHDAADYTQTNTDTGYYTDQANGEVILDDEWDNLITRFHAARKACVCNNDCACNFVCSCNTDCGCNYSDKRLKDEIEYC